MPNIAHHSAEHFPLALRRMEQSRDVERIFGFFAEDAVLSHPGAGHDQRGTEGVRNFWQTYLERFEVIRSEFTHLPNSGRALILEWCSEGRHTDGKPLVYSGASILEFDPPGKIAAFRTYYDSAAFVEKITPPVVRE